MKRKQVLFLNFVASVFAMSRYESDDEYPESCVDACIAKNMKNEDMQENNRKNPSDKGEWNFFKSTTNSSIPKREPKKTRTKKPKTSKKYFKTKRRSKKKKSKMRKRSKKKLRRRLGGNDEVDEEAEYDYDGNDEQENDEFEFNSDDEYNDEYSDSNDAAKSKYQKKCEQQCNTVMRKFARRTKQKVVGRIGDGVENLLDETLEEGVQVIEKVASEAINTLSTKFMKTITADDSFQNKNRPYGMFLQNQYEGLTMVYQDFKALSGQQIDFLHLSKSEGSTDEHKVEYKEVAAVKFANTKAWLTGVSGTSIIDIFEGENKLTTLEVYVENPYVGDYQCCVTEKEEDTKCKYDTKQKFKKKFGEKEFTILKEPQWKKFDNENIRFCRIAISGDNTKIPATPKAIDLVEERSSPDDEANEFDEA